MAALGGLGVSAQPLRSTDPWQHRPGGGPSRIRYRSAPLSEPRPTADHSQPVFSYADLRRLGPLVRQQSAQSHVWLLVWPRYVYASIQGPRRQADLSRDGQG